MGGGLLRTFYTLSVEEEMHNLRVVIKVYLGSLLEVLLKKIMYLNIITLLLITKKQVNDFSIYVWEDARILLITE